VLTKGFYPRIHDKRLDPVHWLGNYFQSYIERDACDILNVGDLDTFSRFVRLCAGRNGQLLNLSSIANDCGITHTTSNSKRWISILEASFIVFRLRPHFWKLCHLRTTQKLHEPRRGACNLLLAGLHRQRNWCYHRWRK